MILKMKGYIYILKNKVNDKAYIGQTRQKLKVRYWLHLNAKDNSPIHTAIKKYGVDNFEFSVIEEINYDDLEILVNNLNLLEIKYIKEYNTLCPNGYNVEIGGNSSVYTRVPTKQIEHAYYDIAKVPVHKIPYQILPLYAILYVYANPETKDCHITLEVLKDKLGISVPTIRNYMNELLDLELLSKNNNVYQIIEQTDTVDFNLEFIETDKIRYLLKAYLMKIFPKLTKTNSTWTISDSNLSLSRFSEISESSIRKYNKELQQKNYLTIVKDQGVNIKYFNLSDLGQTVIKVLEDHETRISDNEKDIFDTNKKVFNIEEILFNHEKRIIKLEECCGELYKLVDKYQKIIINLLNNETLGERT